MSLPNFPLTGGIVSNNITSDRISLVNNAIGNKFFPQGQYLFYTKNSSIWYKYKTATSNWSNEKLWVAGANSSNTKFDNNGYPITGYIDRNGEVKVNHYDSNGNFLTNTVAITGYLPTIAINNSDTYLFWVPPSYSDHLNYASLGTGFNDIFNYGVTAPGSIDALQIELVDQGRFLFTFQVDNGSSQKVYVAFTDPNVMFLTYDLTSFVEFVQGTYFNDDFIVGEIGETYDINNTSAGSHEIDDVLMIKDAMIGSDLILVQNGTTVLSDYFVVADIGDVEAISTAVIQTKMNDLLEISGETTDFALTLIPQTSNSFKDYFVLQDIANSEVQKLAVLNPPAQNDVMYIKESNAPIFTITDTADQALTDAGKLSDLMVLADVGSSFALMNFNPGGSFAPQKEYLVIEDGIFSYGMQVVALEGVGFSEYFEIAGDKVAFSTVRVLGFDDKVSETFEIRDAGESYELFPSVSFSNREAMVVGETGVMALLAVGVDSAKFFEYMSIREPEVGVAFFPVISEMIRENFDLGIGAITGALNVAKVEEGVREYMQILEEGVGVEFFSVIRFNIPKDLGIYEYEVHRTAINGIPLVTFTSTDSANVLSYYYYLNTGEIITYPSGVEYTIVIGSPNISYNLNRIQ